MKIALAGVGHWHTPLYLEPLLALGGHEVICVSDSNPATAAAYGERLGCAHGTNFAELCDATRPDFALVLGVHGDMAAEVRALISARIPFAVEKPAGLTSAEVADLAAAASASGVFVSVPMVFRSSGFYQQVQELMVNEKVLYADFKFVAGMPDRYRAAGCDWMFDRSRSGGGCLLNLGCHFIDLFQLMTSTTAGVETAALANLAGNGNVEDYATIVLRNGDVVGRVETAYLYPAPAGIFDMHFSVRTERHYLACTGPGQFELSTLDGSRKVLTGTTTNMPIYPAYVAEVLDQVSRGAPPIADLADMARILATTEQAYALAGTDHLKGHRP